MTSDPDAEWYFDHVLYYAESDSNAVVRVDDVVRWEAWWRAQARAVRAEWPRLADRALTQGFVLTSSQMHDLGVPRSTARGFVRRGQWGVPARGVISLVGPNLLSADAPDRWTLARREHALHAHALAATNPRHVVTAGSAAVLRGLPVYALPELPQLTTVVGNPTRRRGARVAAFTPDDVQRVYGTPVATVARTVVDVARAGRRDGLVVADAALHAERVTADDLASALGRATRWPGVAQAHAIVALADGRAESPLESILRLAVHDSGLPAPRLQVEIRVPGQRRPYRVDQLWPERRLIVEADGRTKYGVDGDRPADEVRWAEKRREVALSRLGYRVERVLWSDVVHSWPATCALLREALGC